MVRPLLVVAALLAAGSCCAQQLFTFEIAGVRTNSASGTTIFNAAPGLSTNLPATISNLAVDRATGTIFMTVPNNAGASTVLAALRSPGGIYTLTTVAGNYGSSSSADGVGTAANFQQLYAVAVDGASNVYVTDTTAQNVRKLTPSGGTYTVSTVMTGFASIFGIAATSDGVLYVTDGNTIFELVNTGGTWSKTAIAGGSQGSADGAFAPPPRSRRQHSAPALTATLPCLRPRACRRRRLCDVLESVRFGCGADCNSCYGRGVRGGHVEPPGAQADQERRDLDGEHHSGHRGPAEPWLLERHVHRRRRQFGNVQLPAIHWRGCQRHGICDGQQC